MVAFRKEYRASLSEGEVAYDEKVMRKKAHDNWDLVEPADRLVFQEQADLLKQQKEREELKEKKAEAQVCLRIPTLSCLLIVLCVMQSKPKPAQRKKKREEDNVQPAKKGKSAMTDFFPVAGDGASAPAPKGPTPYQCFVSRFRDEYKIGAERAGSVFSEKEMRAAAKAAWSEFNDLKLPFVKEAQQLAAAKKRAEEAAVKKAAAEAHLAEGARLAEQAKSEAARRIKVEMDEMDYSRLRQYYCEPWVESDAPVLGNSGTKLRHKRKRVPRIEANTKGWKRLSMKLKELDRAGNQVEAYKLLRQLHDWEVRNVVRGLPMPGFMDNQSEVQMVDAIDLTNELEPVDLDTFILEVLFVKQVKAESADGLDCNALSRPSCIKVEQPH